MNNAPKVVKVHCCNCNNIMKLYEHQNGSKSGQCPVCKAVVSTSLHKQAKQTI